MQRTATVAALQDGSTSSGKGGVDGECGGERRWPPPESVYVVLLKKVNVSERLNYVNYEEIVEVAVANDFVSQGKGHKGK